MHTYKLNENEKMIVDEIRAFDKRISHGNVKIQLTYHQGQLTKIEVEATERHVPMRVKELNPAQHGVTLMRKGEDDDKEG